MDEDDISGFLKPPVSLNKQKCNVIIKPAKARKGNITMITENELKTFTSLFSKRVDAIIRQMGPSVKEDYMDTLKSDVEKDILFEQWDKFCEEWLDPAIKRTAKRLYDGRNIASTGMITSKQEFKAYYNIKGDTKWIPIDLGQKKLHYYRVIRDRCVGLKYYYNACEEIEEKIKFPFTPEEYEKFEDRIKKKVMAVCK